MQPDHTLAEIWGIALCLGIIVSAAALAFDYIRAAAIALSMDFNDWIKAKVKVWRESHPHRGWQPTDSQQPRKAIRKPRQ